MSDYDETYRSWGPDPREARRPFEYNARLLELELAARNFRRRFVWALIGYVILCVGIATAFFIDGRQTDDIDAATTKLEAQAKIVALTAGAFCEAGRRRDELEPVVLERLADGEKVRISELCAGIVKRIEEAD